MQCTESVLDCLKEQAQQHAEGIDWQKACEQVNDPRRKQGQRFRLTSILLHHAGFSTIAARLCYNSGHPHAALAVLCLSL
jgi:hypothetical protein